MLQADRSAAAAYLESRKRLAGAGIDDVASSVGELARRMGATRASLRSGS